MARRRGLPFASVPKWVFGGDWACGEAEAGGCWGPWVTEIQTRLATNRETLCTVSYDKHATPRALFASIRGRSSNSIMSLHSHPIRNFGLLWWVSSIADQLGTTQPNGLNTSAVPGRAL